MAAFYFSQSTGNDSTGTGTVGNPWQNFWVHKSSAGALSPGDICYFKAGDTWTGGSAYVNVDSNGTSGNPIILDRYGSGADPIFTTAAIQTGWSLYSGSIYSKSGLFADTYTVGVDGTYALGRWTGATASLPAGCYKNVAGTIYIRLSDSSDPAGHTIWVPSTYQYEAYRGVVRGSTSRGSYVSMNRLKTMYCNGRGFSFSQPNSTFNDCTAVGNGEDGFAFAALTSSSELASYCRAYRCYASYNNAMGNGYSQAYTVSAPYCWLINCTAEYNFKEGFDFLASPNIPGSEVHHGGMVYCTSYQNNQDRAFNIQGAGIYFDGGHDLLLYGCVSTGSGTGYDTNESRNFQASTESDENPVYNIHIVNNLFADAKGYNVSIANGGDYPAQTNGAAVYGCTVVNNTFIKSGSGYGGCFYATGMTGTPTKNIYKNNIHLRLSGTYPIFMWATNLTSTNFEMDYNCYYDAGKSTILSTADGSPSYTLAQWQALYGLDTNSFFSNPNLVNTTYATLDARLTVATSPCINTGVNTPWTPPQWVIDADVLQDDGAVAGTTRPDGVIDSGTLDMGYHYYAPNPYGSLTSTAVTPATLYLNTTNTVTITFTTANAIPADGKIVVTFPTTLAGGFTFDSTGTTAATFNSGGSGTLAVSRTGSIVTLTRSGGSSIAGSTAVSIALTYVLNPNATGSTGAYELKSTTSGGTSIDIDTNVSANQIITPPSSYVSMTIGGGITLSNIRILA